MSRGERLGLRFARRASTETSFAAGLSRITIEIKATSTFIVRNSGEPSPVPSPTPPWESRITALNPTLMATWGAAVTTAHSFDVVAFGPGRALPFAIGVALGITGWFWLLLTLLGRYRTRFQAQTVERVVRGMGVLLIGLGLFFAVRFFLLVQTST